MDTAQFPLARDYGWDPQTGKGWSEQQYQARMDRIRQIPGDKIFYVELSDVIAPSTPLYTGSRYDTWARESSTSRNDRFIWAICARPVPFVGLNAGTCVERPEDLGGARVWETFQAILQTGFQGTCVDVSRRLSMATDKAGPIMFEVFEAAFMERGDVDIPGLYAQACAKSKQEILQRRLKQNT